MFAKIQGEIRSADGWTLDPCELTEEGRLPNCPDCSTRLGRHDESVIHHVCRCGSEFDVWPLSGTKRRLVMARSTFSRSGHYLNSHRPRQDSLHA